MNKAQKNIFLHFVYLVLIIVLFAIGSDMLTEYRAEARTRFEHNLYYETAVLILCFGGIGVVLGLSGLKRSRGGRIGLNKSKLLLLALPSLLVTISPLLAHFGVFDFYESLYEYILEHHDITMVSSIIFGHSFFTSFVKK
ncbi:MULTISPECIES: hypothetical protein [Paenibacillus]|uniref:Uncharacterized protein n=1 Tax=Paenibacillus campinasensis TaxID=66347 RepID=A0A268F1E2_9BACL|nr:hypothetical protein [Paenibacillus campinasensis]MUG68936.1 hypothetical protein [Paenibacillus campinasensis]PAD79179.1 hypothetical protein CHH67_04395 [Paenibacillus campinasensis]